VVLGRWLARLRAPYWTIGYFIPLLLVLTYALAWKVPAVLFLPPLSWLFMGVKKFAALGFVATLLLTTPLSRVPQRRHRRMIVVLMVVVVFAVAVWPLLAPLADRRELVRLRTRIDKDGVCLQTTDYTCGPAAAVTVLRRLGLEADEGQLAIWSGTSSEGGTPEDMLADGLNRQYGARGLSARCRVFHQVADMKGAGLTLAVIRYGFLVDHWVAVLEVTDSEVVVGDPLAGKERMTHSDFAKRWRFVGIEVRRTR